MSDPASYRPQPGEIPTQPGVYKFRDGDGRVIYVGKAKNLRSRLSNYFQDLTQLHPRTQRMVTTAESVEWTVVGTEVEALTLEYSWIKEFDPRFNVKFRDDKTYPYLVVTLSEEYPQAEVTRQKHKPGNRYFGPYAHVGALRDSVDSLRRVFPIRHCKPGRFRNAERTGQPCLEGHIERCAAPCVGRISKVDHRQLAVDFCDFMSGNTGKYVRRLKQEMKAAAEALDFETAARRRDDLAALEKVMERNTVVLSEATDADVIGVFMDQLEASVQVFHVRGGRIRGQRGWIAELLDESTPADIVERALAQLYAVDAPPSLVLVSDLDSSPDYLQRIESYLGSRTRVRQPQRGEKKALIDLVIKNAQQAHREHLLRRSSDMTARHAALEELAEYLDLDTAPLRIECIDISHLGGTDVVASLVVFEDGLPKKSAYRKYNISGEAARDDTASMHDVLTRRLIRHKNGEADDVEDAKRFAYPPSLIVVDGGAPQVNAAQRAFEEQGVDDIALIGLAKRLEEVWLPGEDFPLVLPRRSQALYLLQRLRDEAHRFAHLHQRSRRAKTFKSSQLDGIAGLGPARREQLLNAFRNMSELRKASVDEIAQVKGFGPELAERVWRALQSDAVAPSVNMTTGEVID